MALRDDIMAAVKEAMKSGDKKRLGTLRLMQAAIKDKDINSRTDGHDSALTPDSGISELFAKMVKQRQDSVAAVIAAVGATSVKDMGKVMAELKAKYAGQMDMGKAGGIVKALLG